MDKFKTIFLFTVLLIIIFSGCSNKPEYTPGDTMTFTAGNISFTMIYVPAKRFLTGIDNKSVAAVRKPFWIAETEVTYELWDKVSSWAENSRGYNFANPGLKGSMGKGSVRQPVTTINWRDTIVWCNALTGWYNRETGTNYRYVYKADGKPLNDVNEMYTGAVNAVIPDPHADGFRILTKDEWELAARYKGDLNNDGDITDSGEYYPGNFASGATASFLDGEATGFVAVYGCGSTAPVKSKAPNALGIFDMSGNVAEWCFDWYPGYEQSARVARGGCWLTDAQTVQLGLILRYDPFTEFFLNGFRIARAAR